MAGGFKSKMGVRDNKVNKKRKLKEEDLLSAVQNRIALQKARR